LKNKQGVDIYTMHPPGTKLVLIRGDVQDIPCTTTQMLEFFKNLENFYIYDIMLLKASAKIVEKFDDQHEIEYSQFALPWPLSPRDFLWFQYFGMENDICVTVSRSVTHPDCPSIPKFVRGEILQTGYIARPMGDKKCSLSYVVQVDPKGWIPTWAVNMSAADQAMNVARVKEYWVSKQGADTSEKKKKKKKKKKNKKKKSNNQEQEVVE